MKKLRELATSDDGDYEPNYRAVALCLAAHVDEEGRLINYVLKNGQPFDETEEQWYAVCVAAGWEIVQRYNREVKNGKWCPR
jgi:hypothetical protein